MILCDLEWSKCPLQYEEKRGFTSIYLSITHIKELQYSNIYLSSIT